MSATDKYQTILDEELTAGLGPLHFFHPPGTFVPTAATLASVSAIGRNQHLFAGFGIDWGSGIGILSILAARIAQVTRITGLEISEENVTAARENARTNGVEPRTIFLHADSYHPFSEDEQKSLARLAGKADFLLANPPASEGDDGFGFRREVLRGGRDYLKRGGRVFLSVSAQYGQRRIENLCKDANGFRYEGLLYSTEFVPFDLQRTDLLECIELYGKHESQGGLEYEFEASDLGRKINARSALHLFRKTGNSPLSKWQVHLIHVPNISCVPVPLFV